jgi:hypothetical protein
MKVAYVFSTSGHTASYKLGKMILPQLEQGTHGVEVVGMFSSTTTTTSCARAIRWVSASPRSPGTTGCS